MNTKREVSRKQAWNGFYKAVRTIKECEREAKRVGHDCGVRTKRKAAHMRAVRYARALVMVHGWQDVHTAQYIQIQKRG